ncbi:hypothetical protein OG542_37065 [Streptomyces violaceus]|uniref:hypothetical protein n=1 Tax=Streptomyces violaceus TaxID=1936 RepID=UPI002E23537A
MPVIMVMQVRPGARLFLGGHVLGQGEQALPAGQDGQRGDAAAITVNASDAISQVSERTPIQAPVAIPSTGTARPATA